MQPPMLERNCMEGLHWRWTIPAAIPLDALRHGLRQRGLQDNSQFDWVWELEDPREHKVVIVPKTRRLQIRVHYTTPREKRQTVAWSMALLIHEVCLSLDFNQRADA